METLTHIIIGAGVAGVFAAETIRSLRPNDHIIVVETERRRPYSRVLLPDILSGDMGQERLWIRKEIWPEEYRLDLIVGESIERVHVEEKVCVLGSGRLERFDRLLLATGAVPLTPPIPGIDAPNSFGLRSYDDVTAMMSRMARVKDAIVVGGGFVGLKAAEALEKIGKNVVVVEALERLLPRVLDETASMMLEKKIAARGGVRLITGTAVKSFKHENGVIQTATLSDGRVFPADLVILAVGTRPNIPDDLRGKVKACPKGVIVDSRMRTSLEMVFAAGDVAACPGFFGEEAFNNAIWPSASSQGYIAGSNMAGHPCEHEGAIPSNVVEVFGFRVATIGYSASGDEFESEVLASSEEIYKKAVFSRGRPVGFIAVGDTSDAGLWLSSVRKGRIALRGLKAAGRV